MSWPDMKVRNLVLILLSALIITSLVLPNTPDGGVAPDQPPAAVPAVSANDYFNYSFPYQYTAPPVPAAIGARGVQGPTVPASQIGPSGQIGAAGHVGPAGSVSTPTLASKQITVELHVLTGTVSSSSPAPSTNVVLTNITTGTVYQGVTSSEGYVNISLPSGWYFLTIPSTSSSYVDFSQQTYLRSSVSITRYLLPASGTTVPTSGGGSGSVWFSEGVNTGTNFYPPQLYVTLYSGSSTLASGYTADNGSVGFTNLNTASSYGLRVDGWSNPDSGVRYFMSNTSLSFSFSNGNTRVIRDSSIRGISSTTSSSIVAPTGNSPWYFNTSATIAGGVTYVSTNLDFGSGVTVTFSDAEVFFNESYTPTGAPGQVRFYNSTVYFLSTANPEFQSTPGILNVIAYDSIFYGVGASSLPGGNGGIELGFINATSSYFGYLDTGSGEVFGTFYNDIFANSTGIAFSSNSPTTTTLLYTSIYDTSLTGGSSQTGTINFTHASTFNCTYFFYVQTFDLYNSILNTTIQYAPGSIIGFLHVTQFNVYRSTLTVTVPSYATRSTASWNSYYNSMPSSVRNYGDLQYYLPQVANISNSILTAGFPNVNTTWNLPNVFYNDIFDFNYTSSQVSRIVDGYNSNPVITLAGRQSFNTYVDSYFTYSTINLATWAFMRPGINGHNVTYSHDYFPYIFAGPTYSYFRLFSANPAWQQYADFSNDTFGAVFMNYNDFVQTQSKIITRSGVADIWTNTHTNVDWNYYPVLNINHVTFMSPMLAGGGSNGIPGVIELSERVIANISYNLFENSPSAQLGASGQSIWNTWAAEPYSEDILASAGIDVQISHNWFLNLSNQTVPIGTDQVYQNGGTGGNITLTDNHFFWKPESFQMYMPNENWSTSQYIAGFGPQDSIIGGNNISRMMYEMPIGYSSTVRGVSGGSYVFNTTVGQKAPSYYMTNPVNHYDPATWSWAIIPSFVWTRSSYVLQYQGMGGPQPNFTFAGHSYREALEPNMTYVSADSVNAPSIPLAFSFLNTNSSQIRTYYLYQLNATAGRLHLVGTANQTSPYTNMTAVYNPVYDGAAALYFVNYTVTNSVTKKTTKPYEFSVVFNETGLPVNTTWTVTLNGTQVSTGQSTLFFNLTNGSYGYSVGVLPGYSPSPSSGSLLVNGSDIAQPVLFQNSTNSTQPPPGPSPTPTPPPTGNTSTNLGGTSLLDITMIAAPLTAVALSMAYIAVHNSRRRR